MIRQQDDKFKQLRKDAQQELERLQTVDKEFAEILDRAWKELELSTGKKRYRKPKPEKIPMARPADVPEETPPEPQKDRAPESTPQPEPEKETIPKPEAKESEKTLRSNPYRKQSPSKQLRLHLKKKYRLYHSRPQTHRNRFSFAIIRVCP